MKDMEMILAKLMVKIKKLELKIAKNEIKRMKGYVVFQDLTDKKLEEHKKAYEILKKTSQVVN